MGGGAGFRSQLLGGRFGSDQDLSGDGFRFSLALGQCALGLGPHPLGLPEGGYRHGRRIGLGPRLDVGGGLSGDDQHPGRFPAEQLADLVNVQRLGRQRAVALFDGFQLGHQIGLAVDQGAQFRRHPSQEGPHLSGIEAPEATAELGVGHPFRRQPTGCRHRAQRGGRSGQRARRTRDAGVGHTKMLRPCPRMRTHTHGPGFALDKDRLPGPNPPISGRTGLRRPLRRSSVGPSSQGHFGATVSRQRSQRLL